MKTIETVFEDKRGTIENVLKQADVIRIKSNKGSRRAGHYHKEFGHWCLVTKGDITYYERRHGTNETPTKTVYNVGDVFWTGTMLDHLMVFENFDENEFYCFSEGNRDKENYETDTIRICDDLKAIYVE